MTQRDKDKEPEQVEETVEVVEKTENTEPEAVEANEAVEVEVVEPAPELEVNEGEVKNFVNISNTSQSIPDNFGGIRLVGPGEVISANSNPNPNVFSEEG